MELTLNNYNLHAPTNINSLSDPLFMD